MKAILKKGPFRIGHGRSYELKRGLQGGSTVNIMDMEDHPIFGKRYKILGYDEWFEENCFELILY